MGIEGLYVRFQIILVLFILPIVYKLGYSDYAFVIYFGISLVYIIATRKHSGKVPISSFWTAFLCFFWMIFEFIIFSFTGIARIVQFLCVIATVIANSNVTWRKKDYVFLRVSCSILIIASILYIPIAGFSMNRYMAFFSHSNYLGSIMLHVFVILAMIQKTSGATSRKRFLIEEAVVFILIFVSGSRSALLAIVAFVLFYIMFSTTSKKNRQKPKFKYSVAIVITTIAVAVFTIVYPSLINTNIGMTLELVSRRFLNKNFFSGRQILWNRIIEMIVKSPWIGYGLNAVPSMYMDTNFSCHNYWLQTIMQSGLIGFGLFIGFIYSIIKKVRTRINSHIAVAYLCCIIIHECFEVTLTQNELATGIIFWIVMGIVLSTEEKRLVK